MAATEEMTTKIGPTLFLEGRYLEGRYEEGGDVKLRRAKTWYHIPFSKPEGHRVAAVFRVHHGKIGKASTALEVVSVSEKREFIGGGDFALNWTSLAV
jgi:hypothetical protein